MFAIYILGVFFNEKFEISLFICSHYFILSFFCVRCVSLSPVMRSMPAPILSTAMGSASGLAVKHCVRTWDSSSSELLAKHSDDADAVV